jgi:hypothetical protein
MPRFGESEDSSSGISSVVVRKHSHGHRGKKNSPRFVIFRIWQILGGAGSAMLFSVAAAI